MTANTISTITKPLTLSEAKTSALAFLRHRGGCVLTTSVPEKNEADPALGTIEAGLPFYKKLAKRGLVFFTEEEPVSDIGGAMDGFVFTNEIYLTEKGEAAAAAIR